MSTYVYMVRHCDSPKEGNERTRGLTPKGYSDSQLITDILKSEKINAVVSSPYRRSILTVKKIADQLGQEVVIYEDLKERKFSSEDNRISDKQLAPLLEKSFKESTFALEGGESNDDCQKRAIEVINELLDKYRDKNIVIGTHGAVMTLIMGYFDSTFDLEFLQRTTKPDLYRLEFKEKDLVDVKRLWDVQ
ncbi:phosphoglycerate mutase [Fictibacillus phosphorivorans]|uniref:Phosphoglycerate mutase n=1 Tax=Fictibacillus phosphorivorans TaxID=1221500 RepID=A0A165P681_9BACL|nr:histidine phosphatase family protein [Fictibacillus phosphorivorans]KZE69125.1 phosphoglycerate mutase [Fictibacillus phosphorivorans]